MSKGKAKFNPIEKVMKQFVECLSMNPNLWEKTWKDVGAGTFNNPVSGTYYRGSNVISCSIMNYINGHTDQRFITLNQANKLAAEQIEGYEMKEFEGKKGKYSRLIWNGEGEKPQFYNWDELKEKGTIIIFSKPLIKYKKDENGNPTEEIVYFKWHTQFFNVFNVELFTGLTFPKLKGVESQLFNWESQPELINLVMKSMPNPPKYDEVLGGNKACYFPTFDKIELPQKMQFKSFEKFMGTLIHELAHSTGHKTRIGRDLSGLKGSVSYAKEEFVAEMCSFIGLSELGLVDTTAKNHKAYVASWLQRIKEQDRYTELFHAIPKAIAAWEYIKGVYVAPDYKKKEQVASVA